MIDIYEAKTRDRTHKAIANIRFIATRVKRASVLDATQKAETVVNVLNEFRQYLAIAQSHPEWLNVHTVFTHDADTLGRVTHATFQADSVYHMLTKQRQKTYEQEYRQVWSLLENIHAYLVSVTEGNKGHAKS